MKKIVFLFLLISVLACTNQTVEVTENQDRESLPNLYVRYVAEEGFVAGGAAKHELIIQGSTVQLNELDMDGAIISETTRDLSDAQIKEIARLLEESNFFEAEEKYSPEEIPTDTGSVEVAAELNGKQHDILFEYYTGTEVPEGLKNLNWALDTMVHNLQQGVVCALDTQPCGSSFRFRVAPDCAFNTCSAGNGGETIEAPQPKTL